MNPTEYKDPDTYAFCKINNLPYPSLRKDMSDGLGPYFENNGIKYYQKDYNLDDKNPIVKADLEQAEKLNLTSKFKEITVFDYFAVIMKKLNITEEELMAEVMTNKKEKEIVPPKILKEDQRLEQALKEEVIKTESGTWFNLY